jgi:hypothetical protein
MNFDDNESIQIALNLKEGDFLNYFCVQWHDWGGSRRSSEYAKRFVNDRGGSSHLVFQVRRH